MKSTRLRHIDEMWKKAGFLEAKVLIDEVIRTKPNSVDGLQARYLRGRGFEAGWYGPVDFDLAKADYSYLIDRKYKFGSCGLLGYARVLYKEGDKNSFDEIKQLCEDAFMLDGNVRAKMLLGFAYETFLQDYDRASECYLASFFKGSKWGLGFYSSAKVKNGDIGLGVLSKFIFLIAYPFLSMFDRSKQAIYP